jgi:hypothetical protein
MIHVTIALVVDEFKHLKRWHAEIAARPSASA